MYKFAYVRTSGTASDGTVARKRQTFGSGGAGGAWVIVTEFWAESSFVGVVDELIEVRKRLLRK